LNPRERERESNGRPTVVFGSERERERDRERDRQTDSERETERE
jgi:hypothetical protein